MADPILKFGNDFWAVRGGSETDRGAALAYDDQNSEYKSIPIAHKRRSGGSYVDRDGLIKYAGMHEPRVDFLNNSKGHLLLEPSRTNYLRYSEDLSQSNWVKTNNGTGSSPVVTSNYATSPDGTQNASRVQFDLNGGTTISDRSKVYQDAGTGSSGNQAYSVYMKSNDSSSHILVFRALGGSLFQKTITTEWQRFTIDASDNSFYFEIGLYGDSATSDTADILIWGAQMEEGSYSTSYIPTDSYVVSRTNDDSIRSANEYILEGCNTEGVLYLEMAALFNDLTQRRITISDGTYTNRIVVGYNSVSNRIFYFVINGGSTIASGSYDSGTITDFNKVAIKWKANDFALWVNGAERHTDTSGGVFSSGTLNVFRFANAVGSQEFFGKIKEAKIFDLALSDTELQALTS